ncbi:3-methyl-2-oxobutanoate dehydrogenase subunit VorB, partial [Myxococcota bacterium]|nr:3-methyl-2-oxobutanoate dehydrogenase subunit VorB [Myxococcota bacterium]MBU1534609.1 3-methyl-2-oxobutanoate dehydrogenase subunit VorB [Myxococcota bacterium]
MTKILMKGAEAIGEAAIRAGCISYFCYPITPQSEVAEYLSKRLPEVGGTFVQAESEVAASQMVYGAAGAGIRVMTTSSSPGISLMTEGISYIAGAKLPAVFVNIVRGGPGLGGILPSQADYFQATKGGGHGDYRFLALAPASVQEMVDLVIRAFPLSEKYRNPVMIVGDGLLAQMMEPVDFEAVENIPQIEVESWATTGCRERPANLVNSLFLDPLKLEQFNWELKAKYEKMEEEISFEEYKMDDCEMFVVAYGTTSRVVRTAINTMREDGYKIGMFRPISIFPFPQMALRAHAENPRIKSLAVVEMSNGQMLEDVKWATLEKKPVEFFARNGGIVPNPQETMEFLIKSYEK